MFENHRNAIDFVLSLFQYFIIQRKSQNQNGNHCMYRILFSVLFFYIIYVFDKCLQNVSISKRKIHIRICETASDQEQNRTDLYNRCL